MQRITAQFSFGVLTLTSTITSGSLTAANDTQPLSNNSPTGRMTPLSPTAAALQKFVDIPVSPHTGAMNFSVPIYTISEGPAKLAIDLSYHSGGIRVAELASWVGLGWVLNAGGVISRQVRHLPDEGRLVPQAGRGWYSTGYILPDDPLDRYLPTLDGSYSFNNGGIHNITRAGILDGGQFDCEPDVFSFNVNGYSGKFVFDDVQARRSLQTNPSLRASMVPQAHVFPEQDIRIEPMFANAMNNGLPVAGVGQFQYWRITTPDGLRYYFGNYNGQFATDSTQSFTVPNSTNGNQYTSIHKLGKLVLPFVLSVVNQLIGSLKCLHPLY